MATLDDLQRAVGVLQKALQDTQASLLHHQAELVRVNERHAKLIADLTTEFGRLRGDIEGRVEGLRTDLEAVRDAAAAGGVDGAFRLVDTRIMDKPKPFRGQGKDWRDWSESFQAFCGAADAGLGASMKKVAAYEAPILLAGQSSAERAHSRQLNAMLVMLLKDRACELRRGAIGKENGLEIWRVLNYEFEPQVQNRHAGMLSQILATRFKGTNSAEFSAWTALILEYESVSADKVSGSIRCATILNNMEAGALRDHLQLSAADLTNFDGLLRRVERYFQSKRTWAPAPVGGARRTDADMDVDALER